MFDMKLWTVSILERLDSNMDAWTTVFTSEEKAREFYCKAVTKLRLLGVKNDVDVFISASPVNNDTYLWWLNDRYGER